MSACATSDSLQFKKVNLDAMRHTEMYQIVSYVEGV